MLSVHDLTCVRGTRPLFQGLSFAVPGGSWAHVRGGNGAGKTSLLRLLTGLAKPEAGEVRWNGATLRDAGDEWHRDMLYLGHHAAVKEELTALENLRFAAELDGGTLDEDAAMQSLSRFGLAGREDLPVRVLSAGQRRRVLLARTLTRRAKVWILDEPFTALDAKAVDMLAGIVQEHIDRGGSAVVTSHQAVPLAGGQAVEL